MYRENDGTREDLQQLGEIDWWDTIVSGRLES
jgi:hypothetical protein